MNVFNPAQFRAQFPALQDAGVYLDSAATALKPEAVVEATQQFYSLSAGNVHRSQFAEAQRLTTRYEAAREKVAQLLNAPDDKTIVWTRGILNPSTWWHNAMRVRVCNRAMRLLSAWQNTTLTSSPG